MAQRAENILSYYTMAEQQIKHLVRIVNTDLNGQKPLHMALLGIKGVGVPFSNMVCSFSGIDKLTKVGLLNEEQIKKLDTIIRNPAQFGAPAWMLNRRRDFDTNETKHILGSDLDFVKENDIRRLKKIKSYRGIRHGLGLPTRGQRTRSNFRKNKGKVHLGVQRKKVEAPAGEKAEAKKGKK